MGGGGRGGKVGWGEKRKREGGARETYMHVHVHVHVDMFICLFQVASNENLAHSFMSFNTCYNDTGLW
jgi:hypothetical protein